MIRLARAEDIPELQELLGADSSSSSSHRHSIF